MVTLTDAAIAKIGQFVSEEKQPGNALRIYVEGGGCAGFQYGFTFDEKRADDQVAQYGDFNLVIDPFSYTYLDGASVDYVDGLDGAGFRISNPNASGSCGCGHSFTV